MMFPSNRVRVLVSTQPVDFRKGHDGLAAIVSSVLRKDPFTHCPAGDLQGKSADRGHGVCVPLTPGGSAEAFVPGGKAAFHLKPVVDRLAEHLKRSDNLFMDETTAPVLDPGRGKTKTGYLWALARDDRRRTEGALSAQRGGEDPPGVVYFYAPGRAGENAETFLTGFDGILQIDGYQGYNRLTKPTRKGGDPIRVAHCWAHARRKLKEVFDRDGSQIAAVRHCA